MDRYITIEFPEKRHYSNPTYSQGMRGRISEWKKCVGPLKSSARSPTIRRLFCLVIHTRSSSNRTRRRFGWKTKSGSSKETSNQLLCRCHSDCVFSSYVTMTPVELCIISCLTAQNSWHCGLFRWSRERNCVSGHGSNLPISV